MRSSNPSQTQVKGRDAAIQITCNSEGITAQTLDGVTYYTTTRRGVEYTAYVLGGQWFVASHRATLGPRHVGGGRYYQDLDALANGCKAFAALPVFLSLATR
ncbi:hypothetical protein [Dechloromonas hortensis]|uniref:hypothetical protein n=1 Tax=Dechloromonas hortensis TaxID=337779 RepID=UPI001290CF48|nr:hypothetical protein [Dechloromonas hortensis]